MDKVLNEIVDEVALEGDQGCTVDKLFTLVEMLTMKNLKDTALNAPLLFDDKYKAFLWQQIREIDQLLFTENGCSIDLSNLMYTDLKVRDISVTATEEVLDRNIYGSLKNEKKNLNEKQRLLLNQIAKGRSRGISQYELGEIFQMDSKAIFYNLKKLDQLGLIVKEDAYASRMLTKLVFLKRFARKPNDETEHDRQNAGIIYRMPAFREKVTAMLEKATNNIMPVADVIEALEFETSAGKKWARVKLQKMHEQGVIEKFNATDGKRLRQCIRLLSSEPNTSETQLYQAHDSVQTNNNYSIFRDLPSDYVFFKDVEAAGEKGLLRQDLIDKYPFMDPIQFKIFFENVCLQPTNPGLCKYVLHRTEELVGRSRQFRFYTLEGWKALNKAAGSTINEPITKIPPNIEQPEILKEPASINELALIMNEPTRKRQHYSRDRYMSKNGTAKKQKTSSNSLSADEDDDNDKEEQDKSNDSKSHIPSKRANNDKPVPILVLKKAKKDSLRNVTKTRRCQILIDMMEKEHIREVNQEMFNEFKSIELSTPGGQNLARKTFDDLIKHMHDQQKLRLYVNAVKKANGMPEIRKFVLHSSLSSDSPQVKEFLEDYHVQKPIMDGVSKRKEIKVITMPELPRSSIYGSDKLSIKPIVGNRSAWRVRAIENGWIASKWLRAKALHEALFAYIESKGIAVGTVDMADFLKQLKLRTLMNIYGLLPYDDPKLGSFLDVDKNRDTSIIDLPPDMKTIISQEAPRIRVRMIHLIQTLHALSVVSLEGNPIVGCNIPRTIQLLDQGLIRDYATKGHPVRATVPLDNTSDVKSFWRELQTCCLEKRLTVDTIHDENDALYNIVLVRVWKNNILLTKEQKSILDSFIDFDAKTVPLDEDKILRNHITKRTELPLNRVKAYYNSILVAFKKYETQKEKRAQRARTMATSPAIAELMQASIEKRKINANIFASKQDGPFVESTFVASRKLRRLRLPVQPYRTKRNSYITKRRRDPLNGTEKDVLLHAYSIMKTRAENSLFYWSPISKVLPAYKPEKCRRTIDYMTRMDPTIADTIKKLKLEWLEIYQQGIANGDIKDEEPWNTQEYDLPAFLEYFIVKLQEREAQEDSIKPLPKTLGELKSEFDIIREESKDADYYYSSAYTHCYDREMYDIRSDSITPYDENRTFIQLAMVLIKMVLITPDEKYNCKDAYRLLRQYPDEIIEQAVEKLSAEGMLVAGKADYGRIPGRRINVSEKFLIMASGVLPFEFFKKAKYFYNKIAANPSTDLQMSDVNGGTVAAVLDLASQRKISMHFQDFEEYIKPRQSLYYPRASAVNMRTAFIYQGLDLSFTPNSLLPKADNNSAHCMEPTNILSVLTHEEIDGLLHELKDKQFYCKTLYDIIRSYEKTGASLSDIKSKFACQHQKEDEALLFFETLEALTYHKPPLVQTIGFEHLRYVASEFLSSWFIKQSNNRCVLPLMWYDTTGSIVPVALEGCANATMSHILKKPGISYANLRDKFRGFFTEYELYRILKYLLESKRITARKIQGKVRPESISIFSKRPFVCKPMTQTLNNDEITCYWLARNYYL